ncbi:hypothetical protein XENTR_v10020192 [Xenopus tropicalis]|nr:hypothetical protein XENTR_v10020192 [Xenopus tropicalis]
MRKKTSPSGKKNGFEAKRPSARLGAGKRVTQPGVLAKALEGKEPSERQAMCGKARKVGAARKQESEGKAHGEAPVPVMESALSTNGQDSTAASLDPAGRMDAVSDMEADGDPGEGPSLGTNPSESKMEENMEEGGCTAKASGCEWGSRPAGGAPTTRSRFSLRSSKHGCETEHAAQQLSPRCSRAQESAGGRAAVERDCAILARRVAEQALAAADHTGLKPTLEPTSAGTSLWNISRYFQHIIPRSDL